jgi:hypothetical protein
MKVKNLWCCDRCQLQFVGGDDPPGKCPSCNRNFSGGVNIRLAGRDVEIASVRLFGEHPLRNRALRRGLDQLKLGDRCPHGWMCHALCAVCS